MVRESIKCRLDELVIGRAACSAPRHCNKRGAEVITGEAAVKVGSHHAAIGRDSAIGPVRGPGEGAAAIGTFRFAEMDFVSADGSPRGHMAALGFSHRLVRQEGGFGIKQAKAIDALCRAFQPVRIVDASAQHLVATAQAQNLATPAMVGGKVNVPAVAA